VLHTKYGFSYDRLKVLLGGLNAWTQAGLPLEYAQSPTPFASVTPAQP
jgi:3-mercaptopyruvate sulfurtransferase SseA